LGGDVQSIVALLSQLVEHLISLNNPRCRLMVGPGELDSLDQVRSDTEKAGSVPTLVLEILAGEGVLDQVSSELHPFRVADSAALRLVPRPTAH
jgi:hypothetical protein